MLMLMASIRCACHIKCKDRFVSKQSKPMDYGLAYHICMFTWFMCICATCNKSFILLTQHIQCTPASASATQHQPLLSPLVSLDLKITWKYK